MFISRPLRCPSCHPFASDIRRSDGSPVRHWVPEAVYVGFLATSPYEGYKRAPTECPICATPLVEVAP